jgi:hypothetical protein
MNTRVETNNWSSIASTKGIVVAVHAEETRVMFMPRRQNAENNRNKIAIKYFKLKLYSSIHDPLCSIQKKVNMKFY